jgi:hypothetical protein
MTKLPVLYVFVRTDLPSMTPGKAQAHSGHAANAFINEHYIKRLNLGNGICDSVREWMASTPFGFGTQINLKAPWDEVLGIVEAVNRDGDGIAADVIVDPTYPYVVDGEIMPLIDRDRHTVDPIDIGNGRFACHRREATAAYVFGYKEDLERLVGMYPLHP